MSWGTPIVLFSLWLVPLAGLLLYFAHRQRQRAALVFARAGMARRLIPVTTTTRFAVKGLLFVFAIGLLLIAAARPQFGMVVEQVTERGADLIVLLDVSRSMLAEDVAPNRLERAKSDVRDLLTRLEGDRVGLIAFAGAPVEVVPLTTDQAYFRMALADAGPDSAPRGGSLIGDAIRRAMEAMGDRQDRDQVIVLITDGEDHDSFPLEAARHAGENGVRIITIGLGDTGDGARIPQRQQNGQRSWTQHDGQEVWSKMDEALLQKIATETSGAWVPARTRAYDLGRIYEEQLAGLTRGTRQSNHRRRFQERFQLFAALGLLLLMAETVLPATVRHEEAESQP